MPAVLTGVRSHGVLICVSLMMREVSTLSRTCWLPVRLWTTVYLDPLPIFKWDPSAPCPAEVSVCLDVACTRTLQFGGVSFSSTTASLCCTDAVEPHVVQLAIFAFLVCAEFFEFRPCNC